MAPRSKKIRAPSDIFFGHNKSRECGPKIRNFRANGILVGERVDFFAALTVYDRAFRAIIIILNYYG